MRPHPSLCRPGRSTARRVPRRRLVALGWAPGLSDRQVSAAELLREHAAEDVEHPGVFDAAEVRRRAELAARASTRGNSTVSVAALPGVGELPTLEPGPRLAALLGDLTADEGGGEPGTASAGLKTPSQFSLVEVAAAADRLAAWAAAVQTDALAALADRQAVPALRAGVRASSISPESMAGRLVAARVCWSPRTGESRVREARRLRSELSGTLAALRSGRICPRRARVIVDGTAVVSPEQARRVEAKVLPRAERLTSAMRQAVEKQIAADDPDGAEDRHVAAVQRRDVCSFPLPDGLAEIVATLSAEDAAAVMAALNAAAVAMKAADPSDPRTIAQRRADALAEMGWGALASGWLGHDPRTCRRAGPAPDAGPHSDFTAGGADAPAGGADDPSGDVADSAGAAPAEPSGGCGCGGRRLARGRGDRPVSVVVTVPLSTVIGLDDQPAELAGYGPIRRRWPAGWPPMEPGGDWSPTRCPGRCYAGSGRRGDQRGWSRPGMLALPPGQDPHRQAGRTTRTRSIRVDRSGWASVHRRPRTRRADHRRSPPRQTAIGPNPTTLTRRRSEAATRSSV